MSTNAGFAPSGIVLCEDADLLTLEPNLDEHWPRKDRAGNIKRDWGVQRHEASREIERRLRARKVTAERFELGRVGERTKEELRNPAKNLALHYIFVAADTQGDQSGFFRNKAQHYAAAADSALEAVVVAIDYDNDNSGVIDQTEQQQPFPTRFIRG